jgi:hypothetical protein
MTKNESAPASTLKAPFVAVSQEAIKVQLQSKEVVITIPGGQVYECAENSTRQYASEYRLNDVGSPTILYLNGMVRVVLHEIEGIEESKVVDIGWDGNVVLNGWEKLKRVA